MHSGSFYASFLLAFACATALFAPAHEMASAATSDDPGFDGYVTTFEHIPSPTFGRVTCILRDTRGFIWFGTTRGLCRYDGYEAEVFSSASSLNDRQQVITSMIRLHEGSLLLGTAVGIWKFNPETAEFSPMLPGDTSLSVGISALVGGPGDAIWIGTGSHGLYRHDPATRSIQHYTTTNGLSDDRITSLLLDDSGKVWVGTLKGLSVFDTKTSHFLHTPWAAADRNPLASSHISTLFKDEKQQLWIGTDNGGYIFRPQSGEINRAVLYSSIQHTIMSIVGDPSGKTWMAASDLGLFACSGGAFSQFVTSRDPGRTLANINTLYVDPVVSGKEGLLLWIGTRAGLNKLILSRNPFVSHIRNQHFLRLDRGAILSMCEDRKGILWVGLWGGGLNGLRKTHGTYRRVMSYQKNPPHLNSLPNNDVENLFEDSKGRLWIGTPDGLAVLDGPRRNILTYRHVPGDTTSLLNNDIQAIHEDRSGTMWIATRRGLSELTPGELHRFRHYLNQPGDAHRSGGNVVSDILEDRSSNLWVATFGRGLNTRQPDGTFKRYLYPGDALGQGENWIYSIAEGRQGNFWLSTAAGLVSFDPQSGRFILYIIAQLHDAPIFGIFEDRRGDLWLSTAIGLARFNPMSKAFLRFDEKHGFPFSELRSGFIQTSGGRLIVGGLDGFSVYNPDSVFAFSPPPEVTITSVSVFEQALPLSVWRQGEIHLAHDQNFFTFAFAALDYVNPPQNRCAYMMQGVDNDWIQAGNRNFATYTHLDPGTYVFRLKGANSFNVWNEAGTSITIVIEPPYWRTAWFRLLVATVILSIGYATYRYRLRKALEIERMRLGIAADLHDDVGSSLSTIAMVSRVVQRAPELTTATRNRVAEIYNTAVKTSAGMKDIVWFIKPKDDTLDDLLLRMKDTASSLLAGVDYEFQTLEDGSAARVTIEFKRNFFLAYKEVLANVMKHAEATRVRVRVERRGDFLEAVVEDNGRGFDEQTVRVGNGLGSLKTRARKIGGVCEIRSDSGKGTTVKFSGKL